MTFLHTAPFALLAVLPVANVLAYQVPVVNGIRGGVNNFTNPALSKAVAVAGALPSSSRTPGKLRVVENSGVCETTPGVYQASGYGDLTADESIWFWFFEARNDADTAPLTVWLNGGPGSSSMLGLCQENGPCRITNDSQSVIQNPNSWNEISNMLHIDQPVGVGFSHGSITVTSSDEAAQDMWRFLQSALCQASGARFCHLDRVYTRLAIVTDYSYRFPSYGGHYGPTFANYFLEQNAQITNGSVSGLPINMKFLGIGNGLTDALTQYPGYMSYASSNPYYPLVSQSTVDSANVIWSAPGGCRDLITACYESGVDFVCSTAQGVCNRFILTPLSGTYDVYYVLSHNPDPYPPSLDAYLGNQSIVEKIGAETRWKVLQNAVYTNFATTGDWMRNVRPKLESVIDAGVRTIVYDGDADYILNFHGVEALVDALQHKFSPEYANREFANYTVRGEPTGVFKNAGTFSYVRVFGAGHEVPAYTHGSLARGEAALQMFSQIMRNESLRAT
ncbi:serine carboxypeptidase [Trametes maxima]|nr:serine carboxypeptidase [Trametes maxima]